MLKKTSFWLALFLFNAHLAQAQTSNFLEAEEYYFKSLSADEDNNPKQAILYLDSAIQLAPDFDLYYYYRARFKYNINQPETAFEDIDYFCKTKHKFADAYLLLGLVWNELTNYEQGIKAFDKAIQLDNKSDDAYFHRGRTYQILEQHKKAAADFIQAKKLGRSNMEERILQSTPKGKQPKLTPIVKLTEISKDSTYGYSGENPILVGSGYDGAPANQKAYLKKLRDPNGKPIQFSRIGNCCAYKSDNGMFGKALVDVYEIQYMDSFKKPQKTKLYISFYDYADPKIPIGFKTIQPYK
jgi:tetratricopeptide (TPR) repeat protein